MSSSSDNDAKNLSASATTFVPGNSPEEIIQAELHNDEMEMLVASMNDSTTMNTSSAGAAAATASSSLPAHLVSQAAEFWFPDCRDCACCKGYKHGCSCGGLCKCSGGGAPAGGRSSLSAAAAASAPQRRISNEGKKTPCRFYQSGTCKFGYKCRFSHE